MSMSGITVSEETINKYDDLRFRQKEGGLVLKIEDERVLIENEYDADFAGMVTNLPESEPRYVLYDIPMKNRASIDVVKTSFILWMPMSSPVRLRMQYASTKAVIIKSFRGIAMQTQEEEKSDLTLDKMVIKVNKTQGINTSAI